MAHLVIILAQSTVHVNGYIEQLNKLCNDVVTKLIKCLDMLKAFCLGALLHRLKVPWGGEFPVIDGKSLQIARKLLYIEGRIALYFGEITLYEVRGRIIVGELLYNEGRITLYCREITL